MNLSRPAKAALVGILVIVILGIVSSMARAQEALPCMAEKDFAAYLAEKYGETPDWRGSVGGDVVVKWVNRETGTWTISAHRDGRACPIVAGSGSQTAPVKPNA